MRLTESGQPAGGAARPVRAKKNGKEEFELGEDGKRKTENWPVLGIPDPVPGPTHTFELQAYPTDRQHQQPKVRPHTHLRNSGFLALTATANANLTPPSIHHPLRHPHPQTNYPLSLHNPLSTPPVLDRGKSAFLLCKIVRAAGRRVPFPPPSPLLPPNTRE